MSKNKTKLNTVPKQEIIKNTQIALESQYDLKVSMNTVRDVINAYEEVLKTRMLKGEKLLTGLGIFDFTITPPHPAGSIGNIKFDATPERYKPRLRFNTKFKNECKQLKVVRDEEVAA